MKLMYEYLTGIWHYFSGGFGGHGRGGPGGRPGGMGRGGRDGFSSRNGSGGKFDTAGKTLRKPKWNLSELPEFQKNFYREHPNVQNRPMQDIEDYRGKREITILGRNVPKPVYSFEEAGFPGIVNTHFGHIEFGVYITPFLLYGMVFFWWHTVFYPFPLWKILHD